MVGLLRRQIGVRRAGAIAVASAAGLVCGASASAGIVTFDAPLTVIDLAAGDDTIVEFDLTLAVLKNGLFNEIQAVVGSHDLDIKSFVFSPEVRTNSEYYYPYHRDSSGMYLSDVVFGFVSMLGERPVMPLPLGTLTVDATGLGPGTYEVLIDSAYDGMSFTRINSIFRPLSGGATIRIVPEPATLVLLAMGSVALIRRRGQA